MRFRSEVKEKARGAPEKSSREVYEEVMASTISQARQESTDELISALLDLVRMKSSIQRDRMDGRPPLPESLDQLQIDGEWTKNLDGKRFLLFETSGSEKILGFATEKMLECLCLSPFNIMDRTFRVSPLLFTQKYTLHGQYCGGIFCFMYLLLPNKRRDTYEEVLRLIKDSARRLGKVFSPMRFILDFEHAMVLALRSKFPLAVIKGCLSHFTKAIWRNCQKIGLATHYANDQSARRFIKGLMALPFVPTDELQSALDISRSQLPRENSELKELLDRLECYFFHNWVRDTHERTLESYITAISNSISDPTVVARRVPE
ncbi:uncharacterized protein LOC141851568 [Brevipalpus obovatus]|uniref:uncharacterized protein LOC141851568 n=1 Tax=Brevipalpus obovatus TaxID=246614 RepID=UPI003D9DCC92